MLPPTPPADVIAAIFFAAFFISISRPPRRLITPIFTLPPFDALPFRHCDATRDVMRASKRYAMR
jgi:hypothetical protein